MTVTLFVLHFHQLYSKTETVVSQCAVHPSNANTTERHCLFSFLVACVYLVGLRTNGWAGTREAKMDALNFSPKTFFRAQMKN